MSWPTRRPDGSSPLHNFSLPPSLKWGAQKVLRCSKPPSLRRSEAERKIIPPEDEDDDSASARPWNLRKRRAACRAPGDSGDREVSLSPMKMEKGSSSRRIRDFDKQERTKFSIELSKEEVELDYLVMLGNRPPRRPKKRPRLVQRQLEFVFPGSWLAEITIDRYKVPDCVEPVKT